MSPFSVKDALGILFGIPAFPAVPESEFLPLVISEPITKFHLYQFFRAFEGHYNSGRKILVLTFEMEGKKTDRVSFDNIIEFILKLGQSKKAGHNSIEFIEIRNNLFGFMQIQTLYNYAKKTKLTVTADVMMHFVSELVTQGIYFNTKETALVGVQHFLDTSADLISSLVRLGIDPRNIFLLGKDYSTTRIGHTKLKSLRITTLQSGHHIFTLGKSIYKPFKFFMDEKVNELWALLERHLANHPEIKTIFIPDDGGRCRSAIIPPSLQKLNLVCVEQTTKGIRELGTCGPTVAIAATYLKKKIESTTAIATGIFNAIKKKFTAESLAKMTIGIVGLGPVGIELYALLKKLGYNCIACDQEKKDDPRLDLKKIVWLPELSENPSDYEKRAYINSRKEFMDCCDILASCTGFDITKNLLACIKETSTEFPINVKPLHLFSGSSEDEEFLSLLIELVLTGSITEIITIFSTNFPDLLVRACKFFFNRDLIVHRSGYPCNFSEYSEYENTPIPEIYLIRLLLLCGLLEAGVIGNNPELEHKNATHLYSLIPAMQNYVAGKWLELGGIITKDYEASIPAFLEFTNTPEHSTPEALTEYIESKSKYKATIPILSAAGFFTPGKTEIDFGEIKFPHDAFCRFFATHGFSSDQILTAIHRGIEINEAILMSEVTKALESK